MCSFFTSASHFFSFVQVKWITYGKLWFPAYSISFSFSWRIDLEFKGTFSTIRLYCTIKNYSLFYVLENRSTLGVFYISYSVVNDHRHKRPPCLALVFINNGPKNETSKIVKGAHLRLLHQHQNIKGNNSTVQGKTKTYMNTKIYHTTLKHTKKTNPRPNQVVWTDFC